MAETKKTTAPTTANRDRRSALIRFVKSQWLKLAVFILPTIAIGSWGAVYSIVEGAPLRGILVLGLVLALTFLAFVLFEVIPRALADWWGFDAWLARQHSKNFERKLLTLTDSQKAPFQMEHRCKLSPAEEIWVRHERDPQPTRGTGLSLEVLYSKNSGQTWEKLPLRLSPWARFKCIMLDGEWPPTSPSRNLSCDKDGISLEVMGADYWDNWPNVWRATYGPRRKWWTLKVIGPLWVEAFSKRMGSPRDAPARGIPDR